jgi:hypothetical protein
MNTMNMPRFTAEASLYQASERYSMARTVNAMVNNQKVVPQRIRVCEVDQDLCCDGPDPPIVYAARSRDRAAEDMQSAVIGRNGLAVMGKRAEEVTEFVETVTEAGR